MKATAKPVPKPLVWIANSLEAVRGFPEEVKDEVGVALFHAQLGGKHVKAKPLRHMGRASWRLFPITAATLIAPCIP